MKAIRQARSAFRPSIVVSNARPIPADPKPVASGTVLACRWRRTADGRLTCAWEQVAASPRPRPALALVSKSRASFGNIPATGNRDPAAGTGETIHE